MNLQWKLSEQRLFFKGSGLKVLGIGNALQFDPDGSYMRVLIQKNIMDYTLMICVLYNMNYTRKMLNYFMDE